MIKTSQMLYEELTEYSEPANKIMRMVKEGTIIPIIQGKYETEKNIPGYYLAPVIYGPSYLSFDFALAWHSLIPEAVYTFTSATCMKGRRKEFTNFYGTYTYRDVPKGVFPLEVNLITENGYSFFVASAEKALCDKLSTLPPCGNRTELRELMFEDLRIDEAAFRNLNFQTLADLSDMYRMTNLKLLGRMVRSLSK